VIGLYQEPDWETVTVLFLAETTDSLFLRLRPSHERAVGINREPNALRHSYMQV
jgi:hypothetical protein